MSAPLIDHTVALYCITADLPNAVGRKAAGPTEGGVAHAAKPSL